MIPAPDAVQKITALSISSTDAKFTSDMDPGVSTAFTTTYLKTAPMFITNKTNKTKYRDSVKKWNTMLRLMALSEVRAQAVLRSVGLMIYLSANNDSKETI